MTKTTAILVTAIIAMFALAAQTAAASPSAYLSQYLSNTLINSYNFINFSYGGANYVILRPSNGTYNYLVVNSSNGIYRLVTNSATDNAILSSYIPSGYTLNTSDVSYLRNSLSKFVNQAAPNLTDCITETGINPPMTDTFINATLGCDTVLNCRNLLNDYGNTYIIPALENLSINYWNYNNTINSYNSTLAELNASNAGSLSPKLKSDFTDLKTEVALLPNESIFPPQITFNPASCPPTGVNEPWYCTAIPYCSPLSLNNTILNNMAGVQSTMLAGVPTTESIDYASSYASSTAKYYVAAEAESRNASAYSAFIKSAYPLYNSTLSEMQSVLSRVHSSNLSESINSLQSGFTRIRSLGYNQSITSANSVFYTLIENATASIRIANRSYSEDYALAQNDTNSAIIAQLNYRKSPAKLAQISSQLFQIDSTLNSGDVNETYLSSISLTLQEMRVELVAYVSPLTLGSVSKLLDGGFATALLSGSGATPQSKEALAPIYAAIESLIIDAIIILVIYYFTYHKFAMKHRIRRSKTVKYAWMALFAVIIIIAIIDIAITYNAASSAGSYLPFSGFSGHLSSSKSAIVALNGTSAYSNSSIIACADTIKSSLSLKNKSVTVVDITNGTCTANGQISNLGINCYDHALSSGEPVIILSSGSGSISYKGLYGYQLYVSGQPASGASCLAASVLKN